MTDEVTADTGAEETGTEAAEESVEAVSTDVATDEQLDALIEQGISASEEDVDEDEESELEDEEEELESEDDEEVETEDDDEDSTFEEDDEDETPDAEQEESNTTKKEPQKVSQAEIAKLQELQGNMQSLHKAIATQAKVVKEAKEEADGVKFAEADKKLTELQEAYKVVAYNEQVYRNKLNVKSTVPVWETQEQDVKAVLKMDGYEDVDTAMNEINGYGSEFVVMLHKRARAERAAHTLAVASMKLREKLQAYESKYGELSSEDVKSPTRKSKSKTKDVKVRVRKRQNTVDTIKSSLNTMSSSSGKTKGKKVYNAEDITNMSGEQLDTYLKQHNLL